MNKIKKSSQKIYLANKRVIAILTGVCVIVLANKLLSFVYFLIPYYAMRTLTPQQFDIMFEFQPYLAMRWVITALSYTVLVLGGVIAGLIIKHKGWLYGAIVGVIPVIISMVLVLLSSIFRTSIYPGNFPDSIINHKIYMFLVGNLRVLPINLILPALGGVIGERLSNFKIKS